MIRPRKRITVMYDNTDTSDLPIYNEDHAWRKEAACTPYPTEMFVPNEDTPQAEKRANTKKAKEVCAVCPVKEPCLELGLLRLAEGRPTVGTFGGTTSRERDRIHASRRS